MHVREILVIYRNRIFVQSILIVLFVLHCGGLNMLFAQGANNARNTFYDEEYGMSVEFPKGWYIVSGKQEIQNTIQDMKKKETKALEELLNSSEESVEELLENVVRSNSPIVTIFQF